MNNITLFTFETGATTAEANNLVLSVLNNGDIYQTRLHCARAALQGSTHKEFTFKSLVQDEATLQRKTGGKFKPQHITEAAKLVQADTIREVLEGMLHNWTGDNLVIQGRKWWDKVNGNTYFSAWVQIPQTTGGFASFNIPMSYGYDDQWKFDSLETLKRIGFFAGKGGFYRDFPIVWDERGYMLKRDMFSGLYI